MTFKTFNLAGMAEDSRDHSLKNLQATIVEKVSAISDAWVGAVGSQNYPWAFANSITTVKGYIDKANKATDAQAALQVLQAQAKEVEAQAKPANQVPWSVIGLGAAANRVVEDSKKVVAGIQSQFDDIEFAYKQTAAAEAQQASDRDLMMKQQETLAKQQSVDVAKLIVSQPITAIPITQQKWFLPVVIGAGVLILGGGFLFARKKSAG
jgi:hypothetical protein